MDTIFNLFSANVVRSIGWTFVHSIWQGILLALILQLILWSCKNKSALVRYWSSFVVLASQLVASLITFMMLYSDTINTVNPLAFQLQFESTVTTPQSISFFHQTKSYINDHLEIITFFWIAGFTILLLKLLLSYILMRRLRHQSYAIKDESILNIIQQLKSKIGWKQNVQFYYNDHISSPATIGFLKPVILMPFTICCQLSTNEVAAILAHELAHIQRHDYIVNIIQSFMEVVFYYHPAIWWISNIIRNERENCCDDIALANTSDQLALAKALYKIRKLQLEKSTKSHHLALSITGNNKKYLLMRVKRILNNQQKKSNIMEKLITAGLLLCAITLFSFDKTLNQGKIYKKITSAVDSIPAPPAPPIPPPAPGTPPPPPPPPPPAPPVLPKTTKSFYSFTSNGKEIELEKTNDTITSMKVDGKEIEVKNYEKYKDITDRTLNLNGVNFVFEGDGRLIKLDADEINIDGDYSSIGLKDEDDINIILNDTKNNLRKQFKAKMGEQGLQLSESTILKDGSIKLNKISNIDLKEIQESLMNRNFTKNIKIKTDSIKKFIELSMGEGSEFRKKIKDLEKELKLITLDENGALKKQLNTIKLQIDDQEITQSEKIKEQLLEDKIIKNGAKLKYMIDDNKFVVNGKRQSDDIHQKYLKLIGAISKNGEKSTIKIKYSKD